MDVGARILVAGGNTLIGKALLNHLQKSDCYTLVDGSPSESHLTGFGQWEELFEETRPEYVFMAAGASGGIKANQLCPAELMLDNLLASTVVIDLAFRYRVRKLLYFASSCIYPKNTRQPMSVDRLMTGPMEPTNEAYATAKLAGLKLCEAYRRQYGVSFITAIPANPFGPFDDFSSESGHVIPALMRRMHVAKVRGDESITVWGTGKPRRDFIFSEDLADACVHVMNHYEGAAPINIGCNRDISIRETAEAIAQVVGFDGRLIFDSRQPDGMPRKALDARELFRLRWRPTTDLRTALEETYVWFLSQIAKEDIVDVRATL